MIPKKDSFAIYPPHPYKPFGISYQQWVKIWWKWFLSIPKDINPALDESGTNCYVNQNNPHAWFLAGTFGGFVQRECTIPTGKSIFFPVINIEASLNDTKLTKESELLVYCKSHMDSIDSGTLQVKINDQPILRLDEYRVSTPIFDLNIPNDNVLNAKIGITKATSDGYWLFFRPLSYKTHTLSFSGSCLSGKVRIGATYLINIA